MLADPGRIVSLSRLARDPGLSLLWQAALDHPSNGGTAEEVMSHRPDLVLSGTFLRRQTNALLRRLGVPVVEVPPPRGLAGVDAAVRQVAGALGRAEMGEHLIAAMAAGRAALAEAAPAVPIRTIVLQPNGGTPRPGGVANELMALAGLRNLSGELTLTSWGRLPLETVVLAAPDLLALEDHRTERRSLAQLLLAHPAFAALAARTRVTTVEGRLLLCPGPWNLDAIADMLDQE